MPFSSLGWTGDGDFEGYFVVSPKTALESAMYTQRLFTCFPEDFTGDPDPNYSGFLLMMVVVLSLYCTVFCSVRLQSY